jgi:hypothetical protein
MSVSVYAQRFWRGVGDLQRSGGITSRYSAFMKTIVLLSVVMTSSLLFLFGEAPAVAPAGGTASESTNTVPLLAYRFRGYHYVCGVTESKLFQGPSWQIESAEPPLSPRAAFLIAERHAARLVADSVRFWAREVLLKRFAGGWFYVVELEPRPTSLHAGTGHSEPIKIAVLMDGTVAERIMQTKAP